MDRLMQIRCFTCGKVVAGIGRRFWAEFAPGDDAPAVLQRLNRGKRMRPCCMTSILQTPALAEPGVFDDPVRRATFFARFEFPDIAYMGPGLEIHAERLPARTVRYFQGGMAAHPPK